MPAAPKRGPQGDVTETSFAVSVLNKLGIDDNPNNVAMMIGWERVEGGHWKNSAKYNPLNTTLPRKGSTSINSANVQAYQSWTDGIDATVATLSESRYAKIRAALQGTSIDAFAAAVTSSPWGTKNKSALVSTINSATEQSANAYSANPLQGVTDIIPNPIKGVTDKVLAFVRTGAITVGVFSLGTTLVVLGIVVLALSSKKVRDAAGIAAIASPTPFGKAGLIGKASKARALTPEVITARESAKTAAMADRARILAEVRRANAKAPKAKPEPMHPSNPAHPLHHIYARGRVREAGGVSAKMSHAEIMERLRAGADKVAAEGV